MKNLNSVFAAYMIGWAVFFVYYISIARRTSALREAVEPFLLNLFLDPDIIPLGPFGLLRRPIAKLISSRRSIPVAGRYAQIGRRSPIGVLTERQRLRLVEAVSPHIDPLAVVAM